MLAGALNDAYGFSWTMTVAAFMCIFSATMLLVTFITFGNDAVTCGRPRVEDDKASTEKQALLGNNNIIIEEEDEREPIEKQYNLQVLPAFIPRAEFLSTVLQHYNLLSRRSEVREPSCS